MGNIPHPRACPEADYPREDALDKISRAIDLLRVVRLACHSADQPGLIEEKDIRSIGYVTTYALDLIDPAFEELTA